MHASCRLCTGVLGGRPSGPWDRVVRRFDDYTLLPTKGALLPGWLLLISNEHHLCAGSLPARSLASLYRNVDQAIQVVAQSYGNVTAFEHGPARPHGAVGCGIDHLHIHIAPLRFDLRSALDSIGVPIRWTSPSSTSDVRTAHGAGVDYVWVREPDGRDHVGFPSQPTSQLARRAIASALGRPLDFDYAVHPEPAVAMQTFEDLHVGQAAD